MIEYEPTNFHTAFEKITIYREEPGERVDKAWSELYNGEHCCSKSNASSYSHRGSVEQRLAFYNFPRKKQRNCQTKLSRSQTATGTTSPRSLSSTSYTVS